ncbi:MAG TPA: hypothetical protein VJA21_13690 [Verrucomicrobiae bacterium]
MFIAAPATATKLAGEIVGQFKVFGKKKQLHSTRANRLETGSHFVRSRPTGVRPDKNENREASKEHRREDKASPCKFALCLHASSFPTDLIPMNLLHHRALDSDPQPAITPCTELCHADQIRIGGLRAGPSLSAWFNHRFDRFNRKINDYQCRRSWVYSRLVRGVAGSEGARQAVIKLARERGPEK